MARLSNLWLNLSNLLPNTTYDDEYRVQGQEGFRSEIDDLKQLLLDSKLTLSLSTWNLELRATRHQRMTSLSLTPVSLSLLLFCREAKDLV